MPSEVGYPLPPVNQRPQLINRLDVNESQDLLRVRERDQLDSTGVEQTSDKVVTRAREVFDNRFPTETGVERLRGNTEGRNLEGVSPSIAMTNLPDQVQAFNPATATPDRLSTLSTAEAAATGLTQPTQPLSVRGATQESEVPASQTIEPPSINGSGEIAQRFEDIEERIRLRSSDEFDALRPGGPESERVADERVQSQVREDASNDEERFIRQNQEQVAQFQRQDQVRAQQTAEDRSTFVQQEDQRVSEDNAEERRTEGDAIEQAVSGQRSSQPAQAREPGSPTNSSGEPLSSEEQREVERLSKRDREVRAHEQAHARVGGRHVRGGVQLSFETGPDGTRYAVEGQVNIDLSEAATPQETVSKMRQVRSAALAPANPSGADRAVAALASRREVDAQTQIAELAREDRQEKIADQTSGQEAVERSATENASETEQRESADNIAGAQAVIPDPGIGPRASGIDQQSLRDYSASYPMSSPPEITRPVTSTPQKLAIKQSPPEPASPQIEGEGPRYQEVADEVKGR